MNDHPRQHPVTTFPGRAARCPLADERWSRIGRDLDLTDRELQIVQRLFDGLREDAIADELGISRCTVHTHLGRLYKKLEVDSCTGLLLRVFRACLADDGGLPRRPAFLPQGASVAGLSAASPPHVGASASVASNQP